MKPDPGPAGRPVLTPQAERERRWRLVLGAAATSERDGQPGGHGRAGDLNDADRAVDDLLSQVYGDGEEGDLSDGEPDIARWLGDIRRYFPDPVVQVMQRDAVDRLQLRRALAHPELLAAIEPDAQLVAQILSLSRMMPTRTKETAREVVRQVVQALLTRLRYPLQQALQGSLSRATRARRPRPRDINWLRTIHANLKHYQVEQKTVIPETLIGYGRRRSAMPEVILCLDQSGSMAASVVYGSIYAAVLASLPALRTRLVVFGTSVVDLSDQLEDPVGVLFGIQLRGGTNIDRALGYCQQLVTRPRETVLVLITDLFEGGSETGLLRRVAELQAEGVQIVVLLALNDSGAPRFNRRLAATLAGMGVPAFACTPEQFPALMAAALDGRDMAQWGANRPGLAAGGRA